MATESLRQQILSCLSTRSAKPGETVAFSWFMLTPSHSTVNWGLPLPIAELKRASQAALGGGSGNGHSGRAVLPNKWCG